MRYVVDTNIPIIANGLNGGLKGQASRECRLAAIEFLVKLVAKGRIILDVDGEIQQEYHRYLNPRGQPGVGYRFYQVVINSAPKRVERVVLSKTSGQFDDFPKCDELSKFDQSDRKFVAAAINSRALVANAVDSDWLEHRSALRRHGVRIKFICGLDPKSWLAK
jgi:predicted nucleic acid-binding protein